MALHSLLFSRDQEIVALVVEVLKGLDIEVTHCSLAQDAVKKLASASFDAILVDNSDAPGAVEVLWAAKSLPSCEQSIGVVLAASRNSIGLADGGVQARMRRWRSLSTSVRAAPRCTWDDPYLLRPFRALSFFYRIALKT